MSARSTGRHCAAFVVVVTLWLFTATAAPAEERRIALSFDDAPTADGALYSGSQRTSALIRTLAAAGAARPRTDPRFGGRGMDRRGAGTGEDLRRATGRRQVMGPIRASTGSVPKRTQGAVVGG